MIDIENEIFTAISKAVLAKFPKAKMSPETILSPSVFPCVCAEEADNYAVTSTQDSGSNENHANVMYEVNIYSNKVGGKKVECKAILKIIDGVFSDFGFTRTGMNPIPMNDPTKYRLFARYKAVVSKNKTIYRR